VPAQVAVIIVNWNSGAHLRECLGSLGRQRVRPARVIVVDNASSDGSAEGVERWLPGAELVRLQENVGFAAANNRAVRMADGCEWVGLLNPDAFPEPEWLEALLRAAVATPAYRFFASRLASARWPDRLDGTGDVYTAAGLAWRRDHGRLESDARRPAGEVFSPCAAAALYARDAFLETGGFDESFFCYFEDVELAFRLRLAGHRCLYVPDAVARHVGSASAGRGSAFTVYHGHRNLVWTYFKNMPWALLLLYLPLHLLWNAATIVWFSLRGRAAPILRAKRDAVLGLPRVVRQRRTVQARRVIGARELRRALLGGFSAPVREALARSRQPS
jgi:GT2 family glycosyltransferase